MSVEIDTLLIADYVLPIVPAGKILTDHAVAIRGGKIVALLPADEINTDKAAEVVHLKGHVLLPGLISAHGHSAMTLLRGYADDYPLMTWLNEYIWPIEKNYVDADFVSDGVNLALAEMLRAGVTCFSDMYFYPEVTAACAQRAGVRCQVAAPILSMHPKRTSDDCLTVAEELWEKHHTCDLVTVVLGPHSPWAVGTETLAKVGMLAEKTSMPLHIHLHETADEVTTAERDDGRRPLTAMHELGLLNNKTQCVHMTSLNPADIELLVNSGAHVIHCPRSNMKLAAGRCPVVRLLGAGINVALGTDGAASNNNLDMWGEMRAAALLARLGEGDPSVLPASHVLSMATINAATALGLGDEIGSIEVGKFADLIAIDIMQPETQPLYDPISQLIYATHASQVTHSWVAGRCLLRTRQLTSIDMDTVVARARRQAQVFVTLLPKNKTPQHSLVAV